MQALIVPHAGTSNDVWDIYLYVECDGYYKQSINTCQPTHLLTEMSSIMLLENQRWTVSSWTLISLTTIIENCKFKEFILNKTHIEWESTCIQYIYASNSEILRVREVGLWVLGLSGTICLLTTWLHRLSEKILYSTLLFPSLLPASEGGGKED